jgi:hypothetical protein
MSRCTVQCLAGKLRHGFGWSLWAFALVCLLVLDCVGTSFGPQKFQSDQRSYQPPELAVDGQGARLNFIPANGSRVELQGTATIGSWESQSEDIHGKIVLDADALSLNAIFDRMQSDVPTGENAAQPDPPTLSVGGSPIADISVPVMSLHGDSGGMDRDMRDALKAGPHPAIEYVFQKLQQAEWQWDPQGRQAGLKLRIVGTLNMAGAKRPIAMDLIVTRDSRRHFLAHAQTALLMTDFGVIPPQALFGLIKANDHVLVIFDLDLVLVDHSPAVHTVDAPR